MSQTPQTWRGKLEAACTKAGFGERAYQQRLAQMQQTQQAQGGQWVAGPRENLTTNQHILHLLLTIFTLGLWAIVWVIRASQGNRPMVWQPAPQWPPPAQQPGSEQNVT